MGVFLMGHFDADEVVGALPMAGLSLVLLTTLFVLGRDGKGPPIAVWPTLVVLSANAVLVASLLWYSTTWALSRPGTMSVISAYMFGWSALAAGLNVLYVGLTLRSSRRLERRS
jgi:hypothetical protein